jgi:hypothetical protein
LWEQVTPHSESLKRLFDYQLGTWKLALLETIAFICACVDVFWYGLTNRFICSCHMLVFALVFMLNSIRIEAWLIRVCYEEACVKVETRQKA